MNSDESKKLLNTIRHNKKEERRRSGLQLSFFCLIACTVILTTFFMLYSDALHPVVEHLSKHFGYHNKTKTYAVVIDAGSTGTRVLAFEFHLGYLDGRIILFHSMKYTF